MTQDAAGAETPEARGRRVLGDMADLAGPRGVTSNPRRWARLVGEWLDARRELAETTDGRASMALMMSDPRPTVRLWSAAAVLSWDPESARPVLTELRDSPMVYDLHSITAKHTLLEFDAGRLAPDRALPGSGVSTSG